MKPTYELLEIEIEWQETDRSYHFAAVVEDEELMLRLNDFPDEPICTLIRAWGEEEDLEEMGPLWSLPRHRASSGKVSGTAVAVGKSRAAEEEEKTWWPAPLIRTWRRLVSHRSYLSASVQSRHVAIGVLLAAYLLAALLAAKAVLWWHSGLGAGWGGMGCLLEWSYFFIPFIAAAAFRQRPKWVGVFLVVGWFLAFVVVLYLYPPFV